MGKPADDATKLILTWIRARNCAGDRGIPDVGDLDLKHGLVSLFSLPVVALNAW